MMNKFNDFWVIIVLLFVVQYSVAQQKQHLPNFQPDSDVQAKLAKKRLQKADTNYIYSVTTNLVTNNYKQGTNLHFPYPIIFVHGLASSADTWFEFYDYALQQGWSYGGQLPFCLNGDSDLNYSNLSFAETTDVYNYMADALPCADFYLINFNVDPDGTSYGDNNSTGSQSNQAAIVKQGLALSAAIEAVLAATGREKVILFGHSMGGLASREYLQNSSLWGGGGNHHVAKLVTTGTPHGGSNASSFIIPDFFVGLDESSDAIRDLRTSYFYSDEWGVFLFSGLEDEDEMWDSIWGFYDYDVNCNGRIGDWVEGLNQKDLFTNLDYTCIIADYSLFNGDGVVSLESANLNNFYELGAEAFYTDAFHTNLTELISTNFEGLDEPDYYHLAYGIEVNEGYNGFITKQANNAEFTSDYDDYVFTITQDGWVTIVLDNAAENLGLVLLTDITYDVLLEAYNDETLGWTTETIYLTAGTYYLEIFGRGDEESWQYPYYFEVSFTPDFNPVGIVTAPIKNTSWVTFSPNPTSDLLNIHIADNDWTGGMITILNALGQVVDKRRLTQTMASIDIAHLPKGAYWVSLFSAKGKVVQKIIKQ